MCLSGHPDNQVPFPMPESYVASQYIRLLRLFLLYFPCRWFADLKARRKDWRISYL